MPRRCKDRLNLRVIFDRAPAPQGVFETHLHKDAELQQDIDEFECTLRPVRMHVDDGRPECVLGINLRHNFGGTFMTQFSPTQYQLRLRLKGRYTRATDLSYQVCG